MNRINLKPDTSALDARDLEPLMDLYLDDVALRVSKLSLRNYSYALDIFRRWWRVQGPRLGWQLTRSALARFARDLETTHSLKDGKLLSLRTRRQCLARLRQVLRWAAVNEYTPSDYSRWVPEVAGTPPEKRVAPAHTLPRLMLAASRSRNPERDSAIIAVLIGTGMRRAECAGLNIEDVQFTLSGGGQIEIRRGKGGKPRRVVFGDTTAMYLSVHLAELAEDVGPLWRNRFGNRLGANSIYDVVRAAVTRAGLEEYISGPHDFRRLFASVWNRKRRSLAAAAPLSKQLGHTTAAMTLQYILPTLEDVEAEYRDPLEFAAESDL